MRRIGRTPSNDYKRDRTQSPGIDWTPLLELILARRVNRVLASSSLVGELLISLAKLKFSRLFNGVFRISNFCGDAYVQVGGWVRTILNGGFWS